MKKAAIELSINFIVILIISLVIFGFGLVFVYKLFAGSESLQEMTISDIDEQIAELRCARTEKICLDKSTLNLKPKDLSIVTAKILNIDPNTDDFRLSVTQGPFIDPNNNAINPGDSNYVNNIEVLPSERTETIRNNEARSFGFGFEIPKTGVKKGTYIYNLDVYQKLGATEQRYDNTYKIYVTVN